MTDGTGARPIDFKGGGGGGMPERMVIDLDAAGALTASATLRERANVS